jgi:hypothetical protein
MQGEFETSGHVGWLLEEIRQEHQVDLSRDFAALERVKEAAKTADEAFQSGAATATINLPFITATASGPKHFRRDVSRQEWDQAKRAVGQPDGTAVVAPDFLEPLAAPPRPVPISLAILNALNWITMIGLLVFGFGSVFAAQADYSFMTFRGPHRTAVGQVTAIEKIKGREEEGGDGQSGTSIDANHYSFSVAGRDYSGVSYSDGARVRRGDKVTIEFDEKDPSRSRIAGMRRAIRDWRSPQLIVMTIFSIIGLSMIAGGLRTGRRRINLLRAGLLAMGKLTATRPMDVNLDDPRYELTFEFTARDARRAEAKVRTNDAYRTYRIARLSHGGSVPLLFDPDDPSRAYLLEAEPARPRIDELGHLRGRMFAAAARLIQAVVILAAVLYVAATT